MCLCTDLHLVYLHTCTQERTGRKELGHENNEQSSAYTPLNSRLASRPTQEQLFLATSQHEESAGHRRNLQSHSKGPLLNASQPPP